MGKLLKLTELLDFAADADGKYLKILKFSKLVKLEMPLQSLQVLTSLGFWEVNPN